jgi:hypothetical protein
MHKKIDVQALKQAMGLPKIDKAFERPTTGFNALALCGERAGMKWKIHEENDTKAETQLKNQIIWETIVAVGRLQGSYDGLKLAYQVLHRTPKPRINKAKRKRGIVPNKRGRPQDLTADFAAEFVFYIDDIKTEHGIKTDKEAIRRFFTESGNARWRVERIVNKWAVKLSKARRLLKSQDIELK